MAIDYSIYTGSTPGKDYSIFTGNPPTSRASPLPDQRLTGDMLNKPSNQSSDTTKKKKKKKNEVDGGDDLKTEFTRRHREGSTVEQQLEMIQKIMAANPKVK